MDALRSVFITLFVTNRILIYRIIQFSGVHEIFM